METGEPKGLEAKTMNPHRSESPAVRLMARYVDECTEQGRPEMIRLKGGVARSIKDCLKHEASEQEVAAALRLFVQRRIRNPWKLAELVVELAQDEAADVTARPSARKAASDWIADNGWPTGARFVRGTHAGAYIFDPLGMDKITEADWPYHRPSFDEICVAVAALSLRNSVRPTP